MRVARASCALLFAAAGACQRPPANTALGDAGAASGEPTDALAAAANQDATRAPLAPAPAAALAPPPCRAPLRDYGPAVGFRAAWREAARDAAQRPCRIGSAEMGDCGGYRYVSTSGGLGGSELYFANDGRLVAASVSEDYPGFCGGTSLDIDFGPVPSCTKHSRDRVCAANEVAPSCVRGDPLCVDLDAGGDGARPRPQRPGATRIP